MNPDGKPPGIAAAPSPGWRRPTVNIADRSKHHLHHRLSACLVAFAIIMAGCGNEGRSVVDPQPRFESAGLAGRIVYRLGEIDGRLFAATDRGLYRHVDGEQWDLVGDFNWTILDWVAIDERHWLLSTADGDSYEPITKHELFETLDGGETWELVNHDFGGDEPGHDEAEPIRRLLAVDNELYATGWGALGVSTNGGRNWQLRGGFWRSLATGLAALTQSPDGNHLWYGGQGAIENLVLQRFDLRDGSHSDLGDARALLPSPSTIKAVRFDPHAPRRVFACGEGGIILSRDDGASWEGFLLDANSRFYFDLIADEGAPGTFFTAGWSKRPDETQPLILEVTHDDGASWLRYLHPDSRIDGGVYALFAREEDAALVLYVGLFRGGVVRVSEIPRP